MAERLTPEQLWSQAQQGDRAAFDAAFDRLAPPVLGMLVHILNDRETGEEVLDAAFERLRRRPSTTVWKRGSLSVELAITARHAAIDRLRARKSLVRFDGASFDYLLTTPGWLPDSDDAATLDDRRELLKRVIRQLPESQRRAIEMVVFEGHTESEVAEKLAMPLGRAKVELRAAMRFLRHRLQAVMGTWAINI